MLVIGDIVCQYFGCGIDGDDVCCGLCCGLVVGIVVDLIVYVQCGVVDLELFGYVEIGCCGEVVFCGLWDLFVGVY